MKRLAIYRIYRIVWMAIKFFTQVTLFQKRYQGRFSPTIQKKWEQLVTKQAVEFKKTALSLGGLLIKVGQFLSTRADIMPASFIQELEGLTDRVPPVPKNQAIALLEEEWNTSYHDFLSFLSEEPVASASIGEVYKGVLKDGAEVAIKIQRPNIERIIRVDFKAMKIVIWLAKHFTSFAKQINFDVLYSEMVQVIGAELNFLQELRHGRSFAERFIHMKGVHFPIYNEALSTRRVLVMEWIEGSRVTDIAFLNTHQIDRQQLAARVFHLFLEQVLEGGQFHADPHGGNILLKPDGTIVLIDFGMVGSITPAQAQYVSKLVEGIIFKNYDQVLDSLEALHFLLPHANRQLLADAIRRLVEAYESNDFKQVDSFVMERLLEDLKTIVRKEPVQMPAEFAFLGRAISTFVGVIYVLDPKVDLFALAKPRVIEWAKKQKETTNERLSKEELLRIAQNAILPLRDLPAKLANYLEEPTRMRLYMQQRDIEQKKERARHQTRMFTGLMTIIATISAFFAVSVDDTALLYTTSGVALIALLLYKKA
ncbi:AarF/UbiB family protein [Lysinibacillus sp. KU-BSD001]|uniref:ABC1 kinase family protein n=1 Tax=Lysinibacillus sp. KU-BSD001 TaxID=3141328 RepID=UPI0036E1B827